MTVRMHDSRDAPGQSRAVDAVYALPITIILTHSRLLTSFRYLQCSSGPGWILRHPAPDTSVYREDLISWHCWEGPKQEGHTCWWVHAKQLAVHVPHAPAGLHSDRALELNFIPHEFFSLTSTKQVCKYSGDWHSSQRAMLSLMFVGH